MIIFALLIAVTMANPQGFFGGGFNRRPFGGNFGGGNRFGPGVVGLRPIGPGFFGKCHKFDVINHNYYVYLFR